MNFYFFTIIFLFFYLLVINLSLKKLNFSLDKEANNENHKSLLRADKFTPLSGTFYFLPIIAFLLVNLDAKLIFFCSLLFLLGLSADLKLINSYKIRLLIQFLFISLFFFVSQDIKIDTRISLFNDVMNYNFARVIICTFFFMVLINGFNLVDGTNCLCSLNFLMITFFIFLLFKDLNISYLNDEIFLIMISILIFISFNFFGKNFLGDGAVYGLSFVLGYILLKISLINTNVSPYFIANLLWYPAFENLFSIIRRNYLKKNNYLPDNDHLHQLIFKLCIKNRISNKHFLISSLIGISINLILLINYSIGFYYYHHTLIQIVLIMSGVLLYLLTYFILKKELSKDFE